MDGRDTHAPAAAFESDRERDRRLVAAGWRPIRVTSRQMSNTRDQLIADLTRLIGFTMAAMRLFRRKRQPTEAPTYWNSAVIQRIQHDAGVDHDTAAAWFGEMLRFLDLVADSKDFLSPPRSVDVAWHAFILHTRDYESYCRERYGRIIHHQPTGEPDPDAYQRAYERRSRDGAPINHAVWDAPPALGLGLGAGAVVGASADEDDKDDDSGHSGGAMAPGSGCGGGGDGSGRGGGGGGSFEGGGDSSGGDSGGSSCGGSSCGGGGCGGGGGG